MILKEIKELSDSELIVAFYWIAVKTTHEVNSRRGLTNKTSKEEDWILAETAKRFGLDMEFIKKELCK